MGKKCRIIFAVPYFTALENLIPAAFCESKSVGSNSQYLIFYGVYLAERKSAWQEEIARERPHVMAQMSSISSAVNLFSTQW